MIRALTMTMAPVPRPHAAHVNAAVACKPRMSPLRLCTDRHSGGHFRCTRRKAPGGEVRIAQIDIRMMSMAHEVQQTMPGFFPSGSCSRDVEGQDPMRDIVDVTHGDELSRKEVLE